jgi:hypothetical protein
VDGFLLESSEFRFLSLTPLLPGLALEILVFLERMHDPVLIATPLEYEEQGLEGHKTLMFRCVVGQALHLCSGSDFVSHAINP